jgi:glycosyltransferase involved in cell wall biosynthesis
MYEKGIDQIIKALPLNPQLFYIVIGEGAELNNLVKLAAELKVSNRVMFLGYKPNAINYLQFADVYIHPSRSEGFGLALVEAASCKLPLVCSSITTFKEMFTENEAVFFELEQSASIERAITHAYQNKLTLGYKAYNKFLTKYSLNELGAKYFQVYSEVKKTNQNKND